MGIQGLLPLLKPIHKPVSISEFYGQAVGIDTYCWLHKGAYGCAMEIVEGKKTKIYLNYVLKRLDMLLFHNVKPYLVLDGGHLPSKANKEEERRRSRQENKAKGLALLRAGNKSQAHECFQKCVDITPEMALEVIKACRERNIDYIVAPYEADAQLAFLMKTGITQATISEDSDLLVYGCNKVIFKMDECGSGMLVDLADLPKLSDLKMHEFTMEKFKEMCILSGCDYLPSIKGVGLKTANKLIRKHSTMEKLVRSIRLENKLKVPVDYEKSFQQACETFLYQLVFDPRNNSVVPLTPLPEGIRPGDLAFAGPMLSHEKATGIALGNINPITGEVMDDYDPNKNQTEAPPLPDGTPSTCAFSFGIKNDRQSLTPSSSESLHVLDANKTLDKGSSVGNCRRFLLPPLKKTSQQKEEDAPDDKELLNMYTFVKRKASSSSLRTNRVFTNGCGISRQTKMKNPFKTGTRGEATNYGPATRKPRLKNPFRAVKDQTSDNECDTTEQTSCYFSTGDVDKPVKQELNTDDPDPSDLSICDAKNNDNRVDQTTSNELDDAPSLPCFKDDDSDVDDTSDAEKENTPSQENDSAHMSTCDTSSYKFNSQERQLCSLDVTEPIEDTSLPMSDSQRSCNSDSSIDTGVTNRMKKPLNVYSSQDNSKTIDMCTNSRAVSSLHRFTYQPKIRTSIESLTKMNHDSDNRGNEATGSLVSTPEVTDSGYLSDEEESTGADTPSDNKRDEENDLYVQEDTRTPQQWRSVGDVATTKRFLHLKNPPTVRRTTGLSRCKSLGISKRKSKTKPVHTGNAGSSTLFNYFEFNKNKRARLELS